HNELQYIPFVLRVALHGFDEIRNQFVAPFQFNINVRPTFANLLPHAHQMVKRGDEPYERHQDGAQRESKNRVRSHSSVLTSLEISREIFRPQVEKLRRPIGVVPKLLSGPPAASHAEATASAADLDRRRIVGHEKLHHLRMDYIVCEFLVRAFHIEPLAELRRLEIDIAKPKSVGQRIEKPFAPNAQIR